MFVVELPKDFFDRIPSWVYTLMMLINSTVLSIFVYAMIDYCIKTRKPSALFKKSVSNLDVWNKIRQN